MYVDELIKELEVWKSPEAEVTVNGIDISRVTASSRGHKLEIVPSYEVMNEELEELNDQVNELEEALGWKDSNIEDLEDQVEGLKYALEKALDFLRDFRDGEILEDKELLEKVIDLVESEIDKELYLNG